jgi:hypothetical protein
MARKRSGRVIALFFIGAVLVIGSGLAYRAIVAPWRGDVREPLIVAAFVGVVYFITLLIGLRWFERREELARRDQQS